MCVRILYRHRVKKINEQVTFRQRGFGRGHLYLHPVSLPQGLCQCFCSSYLWDKSVFHLFIKSNILNTSATKTNRRLLCTITFFWDFKQSFVFLRTTIVGVTVLSSVALFCPPSVLSTQEGRREQVKRRKRTATGSSRDGRTPPNSTQQQHCYLRPT